MIQYAGAVADLDRLDHGPARDHLADRFGRHRSAELHDQQPDVGLDGRWQVVARRPDERHLVAPRDIGRVGWPECRIAREEDREVDTVREGRRVDLLAEVDARSGRRRRGSARRRGRRRGNGRRRRRARVAEDQPDARDAEGHRAGHRGQHEQRDDCEHKGGSQAPRRTAPCRWRRDEPRADPRREVRAVRREPRIRPRDGRGKATQRGAQLVVRELEESLLSHGSPRSLRRAPRAAGPVPATFET